MLIIFFRVLFIYILIIAMLRLMGKRQLGQLQPSELVVTILVSDLATMAIEDPNLPLIGGLFPILTLVSFDVLVSVFAMKYKKVHRLISGTPRIIIQDGILDQHELRELRLTVEDLIEQLRVNNIFDIRDVALAIVETTGKLSIWPKYGAQPITPSMLGMEDKPEENMPPVVLISDGVVMESGLLYCDVSHQWLENTIAKHKLRCKDIFLMICDRHKNYEIVPINKNPPKRKETGL